MKAEDTRELGLPHIAILRRAHDLQKSGKLARLKDAAIKVAAEKIKAAKKVEN